ncbi:MAG: rhamnogalacturonan acetylesterase [Sphaerochaetaceae bacterium]
MGKKNMGTVFLLGDSTCATKTIEQRPQTGWGEAFFPYLRPNWSLDNRAVNGMSSTSLLGTGLLEQLNATIAHDDWVLIQFGHNEGKPDIARFSEPYGSFQENLAIIINFIRNHGAHAILITPISRRRFELIDGVWVLQPTHGEYPEAMKDLSRRLDVVCIDMTKETEVWLQTLGEFKSRAYFVWMEHHGRQDNTHLSALGAAAVAEMTARCLDCQCPGLPFLRYASNIEL